MNNADPSLAEADAAAPPAPPVDPPRAPAASEPPSPPGWTVERVADGVRITGPADATVHPQTARKLGDALHEAAGDAFLRPGERFGDRESAANGDKPKAIYDRRWPDGAEEPA